MTYENNRVLPRVLWVNLEFDIGEVAQSTKVICRVTEPGETEVAILTEKEGDRQTFSCGDIAERRGATHQRVRPETWNLSKTRSKFLLELKLFLYLKPFDLQLVDAGFYDGRDRG